MKKIVAVFPEEKLKKVKDVLYTLDVGGMLIKKVHGVGLSRGEEKAKERTFHEYDKVQVEIIIKEEEVEKAVAELIETLQTGEIGDGKIFVYPVSDVIRIRSGERGEDAV